MVYRKIVDPEREARNTEIKRLYATKKYSYRTLGKRFGLSFQQIGNIIKAH
jgi:Mor family transcriptional regulator